MSENAPISLPSWTLPALVALVLGGGVGYAGHGQTPAVLAEGITRLREDLAAQDAARQRETAEFRAELRELNALVRDHAATRFSRTDHDAWVRQVYQPEITGIRNAIDRGRP